MNSFFYANKFGLMYKLWVGLEYFIIIALKYLSIITIKTSKPNRIIYLPQPGNTPISIPNIAVPQ